MTLRLSREQLEKFTTKSLTEIAKLVEPNDEDIINSASHFNQERRGLVIDILVNRNVHQYKDLFDKLTGEKTTFSKVQNKIPNPPPLPVVRTNWKMVHKVEMILYAADDAPWGDRSHWVTDTTIYRIKGDVVNDRAIEKAKIYIKKKYEDYGIVILNIIHVKQSDLLIPDASLFDIKLKKISLRYKMIENINNKPEKEFNDNQCALRYIVNSLKGKHRFVKYSMEKLKEQLDELSIDHWNGLTANEILDWVSVYGKDEINVYIVDPFFKVIKKHSSSRGSYNFSFIINNRHLYPIEDKRAKSYLAKAERLDLSVDTQFSYEAVEYKYINDFDDLELLYKGQLEGQVFVVDDIDNVILSTIKETGYTATNIKVRNNKITAFIHPTSGNIIEVADKNYKDRKLICEKMFELYNAECFIFRNQTFTQLSTDLFHIIQGKPSMRSMYSTEDLKFTDDFHTSPLIQTLVKKHEFDDDLSKAFDIKGSYPQTIMDMCGDYPVFSLLDSWKNGVPDKIFIGEYLIDAFYIHRLGGVYIPKMIVSHVFIQYLLENEYMSKENILKYRKASFKLSYEYLADYLLYLTTTFSRDQYGDTAKLLANSFIGQLGKKYYTKEKAFITSDFGTVCGVHSLNKDKFSFVEVDKIYFCQVANKIRLQSDNGPIFRQILSCAGLKLLELIKIVYQPEKSIIVGYNTDSVFIDNPKTTDIIGYPNYRDEEWKPKHYHKIEKDKTDDTITDLKDWNMLDDIQFKGETIIINKTVATKEEGLKYIEMLKLVSFICSGMPGCQKTTLAVNLYVEGETLVLCFTNKACQNIIESLKKKNPKLYKDKQPNVNTFDSEFYKKEEVESVFGGIKRIIVDEFSMMPLKWIQKLYQLKKNNNIIINLFGDPDQCSPVEGEFQRYFNYMEKKAFRELGDNNLMVKNYIPDCGRYDLPLYYTLCFLKKYQRLPTPIEVEEQLTPLVRKDKKYQNFEGKYQQYDHNILWSVCLFNKTRWRECDRIMQGVRQQTKFKIYDDYFFKNLKVIATVNIKNIIYRSRFYYIVNIIEKKYNGKQVIRYHLSETDRGDPITDKEGNIFEFRNNKLDHKTKKTTDLYSTFEPALAITCYKYQGDTIEKPYNILDMRYMSYHHVYTTMSRARKFDQLHFQGLHHGILQKDVEPEEATELKMIKMKKGEIYELNNGDHYYIGCTDNTSEKRFNEHLNKKDDPIHNVEGTWTCKKLIDVYYFVKRFDDKEELLKIETKYIGMYSKQEKILVNTQKIPKNEIKYKVTGPFIDERIKVKFSIEDHKGFYLLKRKEEQKIVTKKIRYGGRKTKEQAYNEITKIKEDMTSQCDPEFTLVF